MFFLVSGHGRGPLSRRDSQTTPPAHLGPSPVKINASLTVTPVEAIKLTGAGLQHYMEQGLGLGIVCFCLALQFDQSCC